MSSFVRAHAPINILFLVSECMLQTFYASQNLDTHWLVSDIEAGDTSCNQVCERGDIDDGLRGGRKISYWLYNLECAPFSLPKALRAVKQARRARMALYAVEDIKDAVREWDIARMCPDLDATVTGTGEQG